MSLQYWKRESLLDTVHTEDIPTFDWRDQRDNGDWCFAEPNEFGNPHPKTQIRSFWCFFFLIWGCTKNVLSLLVPLVTSANISPWKHNTTRPITTAGIIWQLFPWRSLLVSTRSSSLISTTSSSTDEIDLTGGNVWIWLNRERIDWFMQYL